jgi:hypothetical protein
MTMAAAKTRMQYMNEHARKASKLLVGRTIRAVSYMSAEEQDAAGFDFSPLVIEMDNDLVLFALRDPEGNGPGTLMVYPPGNAQEHIFGDI